MESAAYSILIVEDETDISDVLAYQIQQMGCMVEQVKTGEEALTHLNKTPCDLVVVDWMLPGLSGVEIVQLIRKMDTMKDIAVLMLTAKSDSQNIIEGLESGADDYMTKPFDNQVLRARITSLLRRVKRGKARREETAENGVEGETQETMEVGPLKVSLKTYKVFLRDKELSLTPSEFKLLTTMVHQRGRVLTRGRLIEEVQGEGISVIGRTIDTHVFGLRKKLGEFSNMIETIRGVGYRVRDDLV